MEFLFENPFILVVLIGIISSLFKRMKGTPPEEQPRSPQPKPKPVIQRNPEKPAPTLTRAEEIELQRQKELLDSKNQIERQYLEKKKKAEEKIAALKQQQLAAKRQAERMNATTRMNMDERKSVIQTTDQRNVVGVDEKKLVDAIVWAEVLGPPRARKSLRSNRIYR